VVNALACVTYHCKKFYGKGHNCFHTGSSLRNFQGTLCNHKYKMCQK
jgi:hypothetical protein